MTSIGTGYDPSRICQQGCRELWVCHFSGCISFYAPRAMCAIFCHTSTAQYFLRSPLANLNQTTIFVFELSTFDRQIRAILISGLVYALQIRFTFVRLALFVPLPFIGVNFSLSVPKWHLFCLSSCFRRSTFFFRGDPPFFPSPLLQSPCFISRLDPNLQDIFLIFLRHVTNERSFNHIWCPAELSSPFAARTVSFLESKS
jgi:hypothetical protein